jgi:hypothetical protein
VIAIGGTPNRSHVGDMGIDGRVYPVSVLSQLRAEAALLNFMDEWNPVQVKQKDKAGRPDIDSFDVMIRENRQKGFFVAFDFTLDAEKEVARFRRKQGREIVLWRVKNLLEAGSSLPSSSPKKPVRSEQPLLANVRAISIR